ncbi:hypothetical protein SprV_0100242600 [Sparganum proliferum]
MKTAAAIYEANHITTAEARREARKSQLRPPHPATPKLNCPQPTQAASGRSGHRLVSLDIFLPTAAPGGHRPMSRRPSLPRPMPTTNTDRTPEPPIPSSSTIASTFATAAPVPTTTAHNSDTPTNTNPPPTTPAVWTRSIRVFIAIAPSPHPSAWSVTCESIAQRRTNQRLEHQSALAASASTAVTAPAPSSTSWAY